MNKILLIGTDYSSYQNPEAAVFFKKKQAVFLRTRDLLAEKYEVDVKYDLDIDVLNLVEKVKYDAVVTNVPCDYKNLKEFCVESRPGSYDPTQALLTMGYGSSLSRLKIMREQNPGLCIIVYTGAEELVLYGVREYCGVKNIVTNTNKPEADVKIIIEVLENDLSEKARQPKRK